MNKKMKILMTSVLVFVLIATVVSAMNSNLFQNSDVSRKSGNSSLVTETMQNVTQQTNENQDKNISSAETSSSKSGEKSSVSPASTSQQSTSSTKQSVSNTVTSKSNNNISTAPKASSSRSQPKPTPSSTYSKPSTSGSYSDYQQKVLELVNKERAAAGLKPLTLNTNLSSVATKKSQDMADLGYFDHTSPTYGSPFDMMKQFGISYQTAGENIAMGQTSPEQVMDGWMNSPGHRANILNGDFTQLGVGIAKNADGRLYWTQMFIG